MALAECRFGRRLRAVEPSRDAVLRGRREQLIDERAQLGLGGRPLEQRKRLALKQRHRRGNPADPERLDDFGRRIDVDLGQLEASRGLDGDALQAGGQRGRFLRARREEDGDNGHAGRSLQNALKVGGGRLHRKGAGNRVPACGSGSGGRACGREIDGAVHGQWLRHSYLTELVRPA